VSLNYGCHESPKGEIESASKPLIILVIMTITIWVFDVFNEMCAGIKERKCEQQRMTPHFSIICGLI
jgi:hypothetical protein